MEKIVRMICFCLILFVVAAIGQVVRAETTFPVDEAGIAAYGKMDPVRQDERPEWATVFKTIEKTGDDYVIGTVDVDGILSPHLYVRLDGWVVAYFMKGEEASRILMPSNNLSANLSDTILARAIEKVNVATRASVTAVENIKYYDFSHPEATKMTIAWKKAGDFYISIPGSLYEASYMIKEIYCERCNQWGGCRPEETDRSRCDEQVGLKIDDHDVFVELASDIHSTAPYGRERVYGFCDLALLGNDEGHKITALGIDNYYGVVDIVHWTSSVSIVFIYKN